MLLLMSKLAVVPEEPTLEEELSEEAELHYEDLRCEDEVRPAGKMSP